MIANFSENIRLIIWDLDETFWEGTLTEGGIRYNLDNDRLVRTFAERGIVSSICSINYLEPVETVLRKWGIWDYFIFPSINWSPKGPRIRAMLEVIGLRAESCLFLDDNPMNLQQAVHENPGLNIAGLDVIPHLENHPNLKGKDDQQLSRLKQYKVNEAKARAVEVSGGDAISFLRQSNVTVYIEHDVEMHIDRAIELINRTNQLNFTKKRLPEDIHEARLELKQLLSQNIVAAGLVRVTDDFGDYGFVGLYVSKRINNKIRLEHFCFSCRTINMYIEHWVYNFLMRPLLEVKGDVLSDVFNESIPVDWITFGNIKDIERISGRPVRQFERIFARGGCDLASLMHYFSPHSSRIEEEVNIPKNNQLLRRDHSCFLMPALTGGLSDEQIGAAQRLGYEESDFSTSLIDEQSGPGLYLLSFWADVDIPVYRHRASGLRVPYWLLGAAGSNLLEDADLRSRVGRNDQQRERLNVLLAEFDHEGLLTQSEMEDRYARVLDAIPPDSTVIVVLANERGPDYFRSQNPKPNGNHQRQNITLRKVAGGRRNVILLDPADVITSDRDLIDLNHFKRDVYFKLYRLAVTKLPQDGELTE